MSLDIDPDPQPTSSTRSLGDIGKCRKCPSMFASRACNSRRSHSSLL